MASCPEQPDGQSLGKHTEEERKEEEESRRLSGSEHGGREMDERELKRVQLAHEGMRLLLCSQVKQAEELFRKSRYVGPELNAGHSFVKLVRALMCFEDDAMDSAYKSLEGTRKFCETTRKFTQLFSKNSAQNQDRLSPHEKLIRRSIVADCLLFESILVFVKQGFTSYVKGGYILRKAWKMYEKVYQETESLCSQPSPIRHAGQTSPLDQHVGSSIYDRKKKQREEKSVVGNDEETAEEEEAAIESSVEAVGETLASMHIGFAAIDIAQLPTIVNEEPFPGTQEPVDVPTLSLLPPSSSHSESSATANESQLQNHTAGATNGSTGPRLTLDNPTTASLTPSSSSSSSSSLNVTVDGVTKVSPSRGPGDLLQVGVDATDSNGKKLRPISGYFCPSDELSSSIRDLEHEDARLRGAVYFGYGIMNIIVSLIPPKLMKLANLFGFHGDRRVGLQALEYASNSQDMKAPLARIALLWYHTIVRPFFALDGDHESAGADEAERLLAEAQSHFPESALFLYFSGKVHYLRCELDEALQVYSAAASLARDQQEIEHIALYEKGWIHLLQLDFAQALPCYIRLKNETRWSACYYAYLAAVLSGILGDVKSSKELFLQVAKLVKRKNNNLEKFCSRRGSYYKRGSSLYLPLETRMMAVEVMYLWRALPFCTKEAKEGMLEMLSLAMPPDATPFHLAMRAWLVGVVLNSLGRTRESEKSLHKVMQYEAHIKHDKHILSFTLFEIAVVHISRDEFARARAMLNMAKDNYSGYEFEARLNFKVHSILSRLR